MEKKRTQFEINMQINFENLSELDQFYFNRFGGEIWNEYKTDRRKRTNNKAKETK